MAQSVAILKRMSAWSSDRIEVDGQPVATAAKIYLMLNKPRER